MLEHICMVKFHKMSRYLLLDIDTIQPLYYQTSTLFNLGIIQYQTSENNENNGGRQNRLPEKAFKGTHLPGVFSV